MKKITIFGALMVSGALAYAGTPTIDGTFDGEGSWGEPVANITELPGSTDDVAGWNGTSADKLYVTSDATYAYFGAVMSNMGGWETFGFAIHTTAGGGNVQDPWGRQFNFNLTNAPDFMVRGNIGDWTELRTWNGTDFNTGAGTNIADVGQGHAASTSTFVEVRIPRATLASPTAEVVFFISGNNNDHGLFDALPQHSGNGQNTSVATSWNQSPQNVINTATPPTVVPVTMSSFSID